MKISEHLDLSEVIRSETAKRHGISNMPTPEHMENMKKLAENVFEKVRNHFRCPIHISSGYRSKELNARTPGASATSQHSSGEALDLDVEGNSNGLTNRMIFDYIKDNLEFDQLIYEFGDDKEPSWIHVSYESTGKQRKQVLRATKVNGKTSYAPYK